MRLGALGVKPAVGGTSLARSCSAGVSRTVILLLLTLARFAHAGEEMRVEVYKWVDADGVTHYSEAPPAQSRAEVASFERMNLEFNPARPLQAQDYYSIINQAKRMEASRLARERLKHERERLRVQRLAQHAATRGADPRASDTSNRYVYPVFLGQPFSGFPAHSRHCVSGVHHCGHHPLAAHPHRPRRDNRRADPPQRARVVRPSQGSRISAQAFRARTAPGVRAPATSSRGARPPVARPRPVFH